VDQFSKFFHYLIHRNILCVYEYTTKILTSPAICCYYLATDKLVEKIVRHDSWPIQPVILNPPFLRLTSRKPLWLDLQPADIKSRWRHGWKSARVVSSHLVCNPTIRQPGFDLPLQWWSHWTVFTQNRDTAVTAEGNGDFQSSDTDLCPCGETQTMSHIVESCPLTKLNSGLSQLHFADEDAVSWLTNYGSWHTYKKKKKTTLWKLKNQKCYWLWQHLNRLLTCPWGHFEDLI